MATLLLRLAGPLQAWGSDSKYETRKTGREPTKSGVVGLLAAALGIRRDEPEKLAPLNRLRFAVRADREGKFLSDFQIAKGQKTQYVTYRHYLSDAVFLVGLESADLSFLHSLEEALRAPAFPLFLGRRSCPPTLPLCLGVREGGLLDVLRAEPSLASKEGKTPPESFRIVVDTEPSAPGAVPRQDLPLSFSPLHRQYGYRAVEELRQDAADRLETEHDPFSELY